MLPDALVLDKIIRGKSFNFTKLIKAWNKTGVGQVMVEHVDSDMIGNYGVVDIDAKESNPFIILPMKGLVEKPSRDEAPSNLAVVGS